MAGKDVRGKVLSAAQREQSLRGLYDQLGRLRAGRQGFTTTGYTAQEVSRRRQWYDSRIKNVQARINALKLK